MLCYTWLWRIGMTDVRSLTSFASEDKHQAVKCYLKRKRESESQYLKVSLPVSTMIMAEQLSCWCVSFLIPAWRNQWHHWPHLSLLPPTPQRLILRAFPFRNSVKDSHIKWLTLEFTSLWLLLFLTALFQSLLCPHTNRYQRNTRACLQNTASFT